MKISEFRKLIREEVRKVIKEDQDFTDNYWYVYLYDKGTIDWGPMKNKKDVIKLGMRRSDIDIKNIGPVYEVRVDHYTAFVITNRIDKKEKWVVVSPGDDAFAKDDDYHYKVCKKAMMDAQSGKGTQMTFEDFLKK
jgi:hypothetical protein